jgi:hypothetical protein
MKTMVDSSKTPAGLQQYYETLIQKINVAMAPMATMDYYSIYGALLQTPVEGPGFADGW